MAVCRCTCLSSSLLENVSSTFAVTKKTDSLEEIGLKAHFTGNEPKMNERLSSELLNDRYVNNQSKAGKIIGLSISIKT